LQLHQAMCAAVADAGIEKQLTLIRAHPELAGRAAIRGELTSESTREQSGAGLASCSPEEFAKLQLLNSAYSTKFGFPFVLAVKGHNRSSVIAALEHRSDNSIEHEREVALREIGRIAAFRLAELVAEPLGSQVMAMCEQLVQFSEHEQDLTCSYLTTAHRATAMQLRDWMLTAGLEVATDAVGNVIGQWRSAQPHAATLVTGSHYDTVINAGKFDGRLGIVLPLAVAGQLRRRSVQLPYSLQIIAFAEEEGVRFKSTFLGSRAIAGHFDMAVLDSVDSNGVSMRAAMFEAGLDPLAIEDAAIDRHSLLGFVEVHIEQGPVLLSEDHAVGVVTSIAGSIRHLVSIKGLAGHSGTVPMNMRRDARNRSGQSSVAPVEMPGLDNHLCFALYAASNHMTRLFVPFLKKLGVTYPQYLVLVVLWERGAQGVGELASALQMDLGTLSPMLKRLEAKGLVTRRRQAEDERRVLVDLTPKGVSLRKRTEQMLGEFYCFLNMPLDELFDLKDQLRHFVSSAGPKAIKTTRVKLSEPAL